MSHSYDYDWREVSVPARVASLPKDPRGYPIFFTVAPPDGQPANHKILNWRNRNRCAEERLCGVCGQPLDYWLAFVGGPMCVDLRAYGDPPMHRECAEYSLKVCPFLATDLQYSDPKVMEQAFGTTEDEYASPYKPKYAALYLTRKFTFTYLSADRTMITFTPAAAKRVTYWYRGRPVEGVPVDLPEVLAAGRAAASARAAQRATTPPRPR
jgi:hypothetical protein